MICSELIYVQKETVIPILYRISTTEHFRNLSRCRNDAVVDVC